MAKGKASFLLYCDLIHTVEKMPKEKAGELFLTILEYVNDKNPVVDDIIIDLVFEPIKQQLKRDLKNYEKICERNSLNGSKGGRPKTTNPKEAKKPNGLSGNPSKPKKADNDNDNDNDTGKEKKKKELFVIFWGKYHLITNQNKTDKEPALKYWNKMSIDEMQKAIDNIKLYYDNIKDYGNGKMPKKARTYLADKNFNDEYDKSHSIESNTGLPSDVVIKRPKPFKGYD